MKGRGHTVFRRYMGGQGHVVVSPERRTVANRAKLTVEDAKAVLSALGFQSGGEGHSNMRTIPSALDRLVGNEDNPHMEEELNYRPKQPRQDMDADREVRPGPRDLPQPDAPAEPLLVRKSGKVYRVVTGYRDLKLVKQDDTSELSYVVLEPADEEEISTVAHVEDLDGDPFYPEEIKEMAGEAASPNPMNFESEELVGASPGDLAAFLQQGIAVGYGAEPDLEISRSRDFADLPMNNETKGHSLVPAARPEAAQPLEGTSKLIGLIQEADTRSAAFRSALDVFSRNDEAGRPVLLEAAVEARAALDLVITAIYADSQREVAVLAEEMQALRCRQEEIEEAVRLSGLQAVPEAPPERRAGMAADAEDRRSSLIKEIKQLVEYRQQLRGQLETLLGQLTKPGPVERKEPSPRPTQEMEVEEVCGPVK
jgi:hypothetical protein